MPVPDDLQQWFNAGTLMDRNNLPRIRIRYKVVEVIGIRDADTDDPKVLTRGPRGSGHKNEFTTLIGARRCAQRIAFRGGSAIIQTGILCWLTEPELQTVPMLTAAPKPEPESSGGTNGVAASRQASAPAEPFDGGTTQPPASNDASSSVSPSSGGTTPPAASREAPTPASPIDGVTTDEPITTKGPSPVSPSDSETTASPASNLAAFPAEPSEGTRSVMAPIGTSSPAGQPTDLAQSPKERYDSDRENSQV